MDTGISAAGLGAYFITLAVLLVAGLVLFTVFKTPLKFIVGLVLNSLLGGLLLFLLNFIFAMFGFGIGVNVFTAVTVGLLGIPGLIMLIILALIL